MAAYCSENRLHKFTAAKLLTKTKMRTTLWGKIATLSEIQKDYKAKKRRKCTLTEEEKHSIETKHLQMLELAKT